MVSDIIMPMKERPNHDRLRSHEAAFRELQTFTFTQPDGSERQIDMSVPGGFGDFAFDVRSEGGEATQHHAVYWTGEAPIFLQLMSRWALSRRGKTGLADIEQMSHHLRSLTANGAAPTEDAQGTISPHVIEQTMGINAQGARRTYSMYGSDNATAAVDTRHDGYTYITTEAIGDDDGVAELTVAVADEQLWQFIVGMMGRSYAADGGRYSQLSRYSSREYALAFQRAMQRGEALSDEI